MNYSDIEKVTVNGMTMYKLGNELFFTEQQARRACDQDNHKYVPKNMYGYKFEYLNDPINVILYGDWLKGQKL